MKIGYICVNTQEPNAVIIKNAIRCNICGDEIESKFRHHYVECKCGACFVDGGHDYLRHGYKEEGCYTDLSICIPKHKGTNNQRGESASLETLDSK